MQDNLNVLEAIFTAKLAGPDSALKVERLVDFQPPSCSAEKVFTRLCVLDQNLH